jgi:hypothetical protein
LAKQNPSDIAHKDSMDSRDHVESPTQTRTTNPPPTNLLMHGKIMVDVRDRYGARELAATITDFHYVANTWRVCAVRDRTGTTLSVDESKVQVLIDRRGNPEIDRNAFNRATFEEQKDKEQLLHLQSVYDECMEQLYALPSNEEDMHIACS